MLALRSLLYKEARRYLLSYIVAADPTYQVSWFYKEVCAKLDKFLADVVAKRSPRLLICSPPRHGKSEMVSRRFPAFALGRNPDLTIIATSHTADLASHMNRDIQRMMMEPVYDRLFPETTLWGKNIRTVADGSWLRNSDVFQVVGHRGQYACAGVGGPLTGLGADILICDDLIKDAEQAYSETYREKTWDWFTSVAYTRLMPGAGALIILTRWHADDIAGRILQAAKLGGERWDVVSYPAIAEQDETHRKMGEALHPERFDLEALERIKQAVGSRVWASLYQQHPTALEGGLIKWEWFKRYSVAPFRSNRIIQSWDTGNKAKELNDPSCGTTWGETENGYYLLDVICRRMEYPELKHTMQSYADKWHPTSILVEDKASGQSIIQDLRSSTRLPILPINPTTDKVVRLMAVSALFESGRVFLPETASWLSDYEAELITFPNGAHDDQVDSTSQALSYMTQRPVLAIDPREMAKLGIMVPLGLIH